MQYEATRKASPDLRQMLKRPFYVPNPMTDDEIADFALYLGGQGVQVRWSKRHPGAFSTDCDMCPHVWAWRLERGEIKLRDTAPSPAVLDLLNLWAPVVPGARP